MTEDEDFDAFVREIYNSVNQYYLRQQVINALVASGKSREEAEEWINQAQIFVN